MGKTYKHSKYGVGFIIEDPPEGHLLKEGECFFKLIGNNRFPFIQNWGGGDRALWSELAQADIVNVSDLTEII